MKTVSIAFLAALALQACASSQPTPQLVDARMAYARAQGSQANVVVPDRVLTAKQALDDAEEAHADAPGSFREANLAYIAERKALLAMAHAGIQMAERDRVSAEELHKERQQELRERAEKSLENTQDNLHSARQQIADQGSELVEKQRALTKAEQRAAAALASLEEVAKVKAESRGMVITLDGAVLFTTGKSELLPISREKLAHVAKALQELEDDQRVVVEGHTDSRGTDELNQALSQARADAVRSYLIEEGVDADMITAVGRGETQPLATNDTPEGRANNRRVEVIIKPSDKVAARQ
jgi:outer membrane protein OmpA-like peptidoglycan-associated protein